MVTLNKKLNVEGLETIEAYTSGRCRSCACSCSCSCSNDASRAGIGATNYAGAQSSLDTHDRNNN